MPAIVVDPHLGSDDRRSRSGCAMLRRVALHRGDSSPFVEALQGRTIDVRFDQPAGYEIDGCTRPPSERRRFEVKPTATTVRVPKGDG